MRSNLRGKFVRLKHLNRSGTWPSGNPRYYYRRPGHKAVPMPDAPIDSLTFREAHSAAERATGAPQPLNHGTGSIGAAIVAYAASDVFLSLSASTRDQRKRIMDKLRSAYGSAALKDLRPRHIRQDLAKLAAHPANNRLKVWRALGKWWVDAGLLDDDPAFPVRKRATPNSDGFEAWTREDVAAFRAHWPHDTAQRLAFELMHRTCASIGDACRIGPGMVRDGWLTYRRQKSGTEATCPFLVPGPAWFEADEHLSLALDHAPRAMTYLCTAQNRPRSPKAAAAWFSKACRDAGISKTAHGIRKYRASVFKENGASDAQRMAILGHETATEAARYSKSADLRRVITGTENFQLPTSWESCGKYKGKSNA